MPQKAPSWTIDDLIDLEYFMHREDPRIDETDRDLRHQQERAFYLTDIVPRLDGAGPSTARRTGMILRHWLEFRRNDHPPGPAHGPLLPGSVFRQIYTALMTIFVFLGFASGWGLAFSFLVYKGSAPLNVSSYLGLFVFSQLALILLLLTVAALPRRRPGTQTFSLIRTGLGALLIHAAAWLGKRYDRRLSAEKRSHFKAALGVIRGRSRNYTGLFPWPVVILTQVFAVFFNLGVLAATLLRVIGSDLAFGWQSTLQLSAEMVHRAAAFLALPWSGLVPPSLAHPSPAQIEGSRIILKDGIMQLSTPDLTAWWPFLCLAVVFYGLIPRVILLAFAFFMERRTLDRLVFSSIACDRLLQRLRSPWLDTRGERQDATPRPEPARTPAADIAPEDPTRAVIALVPDDLVGLCSEADLDSRLLSVFGSGLSRIVPVSLTMSRDRAMIEGLLDDAKGRLVLLMESWQPPIRETLAYIRELRSLGGPAFRVYVLLTGPAASQTLFETPTPRDVTVWDREIKALGDPLIHLESAEPANIRTGPTP
ncbi:hypothetical protein JCM14469_11130 [Desulfatiferula olefinivorans]